MHNNNVYMFLYAQCPNAPQVYLLAYIACALHALCIVLSSLSNCLSRFICYIRFTLQQQTAQPYKSTEIENERDTQKEWNEMKNKNATFVWCATKINEVVCGHVCSLVFCCCLFHSFWPPSFSSSWWWWWSSRAHLFMFTSVLVVAEIAQARTRIYTFQFAILIFTHSTNEHI